MDVQTQTETKPRNSGQTAQLRREEEEEEGQTAQLKVRPRNPGGTAATAVGQPRLGQCGVISAAVSTFTA
jgi:hypothetical protein